MSQGDFQNCTPAIRKCILNLEVQPLHGLTHHQIAYLPETFPLTVSDIAGVMEAPQPRQQPSNPLLLCSTTTEERVILPPHNSIDWRTSNKLRILHQQASSPEHLRQLTILAQKAGGHLVRHGHDRESLGVFMLDWGQQIIARLQTRHHV